MTMTKTEKNVLEHIITNTCLLLFRGCLAAYMGGFSFPYSMSLAASFSVSFPTNQMSFRRDTDFHDDDGFRKYYSSSTA